MKFQRFIFLSLMLTVGTPLIAQQLNWEQTNLPEGGRVNVVEVNSSGCLFAGIVGGAFYSKDNGEHWERLQGIDFTIDRIVTHNSGSVLLYSKGGNVYHVNNDLIVSKTNYGFISAQVDRKGKIYGFTSSTVYTSSDGGITWNFLSVIQGNFHSFAVSADNTFIGVADKEILHSTDSGKTWSKSDYVFTSRTYAPDLIIKADNKGNLFLKDYVGIFKSTDSGKTWRTLSAPFESNFIECLSVVRNDELLVCSNLVLWESIDAGTIWTKIGSINNSPANVIKLNATDYLYSAFFGVFSFNGITKKDELHNKGLFAKQISELECFDGSFIGAGYDGCYYSNTNSPVWKKINVSSNNFSVINDWLTLYNDGKLLVTKHFEEQWFQIKLPTNIRYYLPKFTAVQDKNTAVALTLDLSITNKPALNLIRTSDGGSSWASTLKVESATEGAIYCTIDGELFLGLSNNLYNSKDFGSTWNVINAFNAQINSISQSPLGDIYVGTSKGLFNRKSSSWIEVPLPYFEPYVRKIQFMKTGELVLNGGGKLYMSKNFGDSFEVIFTNTSYWNFNFVVSEDGIIVISTVDRGLLKSNYTSERNIYVGNTAIYYNYPNPFNGQTAIKFSLQKPEKVAIKIFDSIGQEIEEIAYKEFGIGFNRVIWQPNNLPSGVYFYRIQTPTFSETKKMVYLK